MYYNYTCALFVLSSSFLICYTINNEKIKNKVLGIEKSKHGLYQTVITLCYFHRQMQLMRSEHKNDTFSRMQGSDQRGMILEFLCHCFSMETPGRYFLCEVRDKSYQSKIDKKQIGKSCRLGSLPKCILLSFSSTHQHRLRTRGAVTALFVYLALFSLHL